MQLVKTDFSKYFCCFGTFFSEVQKASREECKAVTSVCNCWVWYGIRSSSLSNLLGILPVCLLPKCGQWWLLWCRAWRTIRSTVLQSHSPALGLVVWDIVSRVSWIVQKDLLSFSGMQFHSYHSHRLKDLVKIVFWVFIFIDFSNNVSFLQSWNWSEVSHKYCCTEPSFHWLCSSVSSKKAEFGQKRSQAHLTGLSLPLNTCRR